jgi:hypothetical protein
MTILYIEYTDNGKGATIEKLNSRNGLQNVENRILAIKEQLPLILNPVKDLNLVYYFLNNQRRYVQKKY